MLLGATPVSESVVVLPWGLILSIKTNFPNNTDIAGLESTSENHCPQFFIVLTPKFKIEFTNIIKVWISH